MTSSSSSFKATLSLVALIVFSAPYCLAGSRPYSVQVPVQTFSKMPKPPAPLAGTLWLAKKPTDQTKGRAILLVHMLGRTKADWTAYAEELQDSGYNVLAIDLRGHGNLGKKELIEDIQSGVVFLKSDQSSPKIEAMRVTIIGASIGANGAVQYAAASAQMYLIVDNLILLSPGENYHGITLFDALREIKGIPVLLVATEGDKYSAETVKKSKDLCQTRCSQIFYPRGGHGTEIFDSDLGAELKKAIAEFLAGTHG